jgi:hypothetical protein
MAIGLSRTKTDGTIVGKTQSFGAAGRRLALTKLAKTNMTQAELDSCIQFIQLTASVTAVGSEETTENGAFLAGTSDNVWVISEGTAPVAASNFGGVTGVTASVVCYLDQR